MVEQKLEKAQCPSFARVVKPDRAFLKEDRIKTKIQGTEEISINRDIIDLRLVEQLVDSGQLSSVAQAVIYLKKHVFDGKRTLSEAVKVLEVQMKKKEFEGFVQGQMPGTLAMPRVQEIYAALNRCRGLLKIE